MPIEDQLLYGELNPPRHQQTLAAPVPSPRVRFSFEPERWLYLTHTPLRGHPYTFAEIQRLDGATGRLLDSGALIARGAAALPTGWALVSFDPHEHHRVPVSRARDEGRLLAGELVCPLEDLRLVD